MTMHAERRRTPYITWRVPKPGEDSNFEVLFGWRWAVAVVGLGLIAVLVVFRAQSRRLAVGRILLVGGVAAILALIQTLRGALFPVFSHVELPVDDLPLALDGLKIAQLSDFHLGMPMSIAATRRAVVAVQAERPDLIALTGDFVSYRRHLPLLRTMLAPLSAPLGVFAVYGNHDHLENAADIGCLLDELGFTVLLNEHRRVGVDASAFAVAGVDDLWRGEPDLTSALAGIPAGMPIILLAHAPDYADIAARAPITLQLAGHTHAGHIRLPILGPLVLPRHGIRYDRGLWRVGGMWLYVSEGLGGLPMRIGSRAEATLLTLRRRG
jgi:predicted MPP superfamily phosphohydrolase